MHIINVNCTSIKEKNEKNNAYIIDCEMGHVTPSEDARGRNDWTQQLL